MRSKPGVHRSYRGRVGASWNLAPVALFLPAWLLVPVAALCASELVAYSLDSQGAQAVSPSLTGDTHSVLTPEPLTLSPIQPSPGLSSPTSLRQGPGHQSPTYWSPPAAVHTACYTSFRAALQ